MESVLDKCLTPTTEMIANLVEIENAHINTNHPDFVGSADSLLNLFSNDQDQDDSDGEQGPPTLLNKGGDKGKGFDAEVIDEAGENAQAKEGGGDQGSGDYISSVFDMFRGTKKQEKESKKAQDEAADKELGRSQML